MRRIAAVSLCLLLGACSPGAKPLGAAEAVPHYDAVVAQVRDSLKPLGITYKPVRQRAAKPAGGGCTYTVGHYDPTSVRVGAPIFDDPAWAEVKEAFNAKVAPASGFAALGEPQRAGADFQVTTKDAHGATLIIRKDGGFTIHGASVDTKDCTDAALGI